MKSVGFRLAFRLPILENLSRLRSFKPHHHDKVVRDIFLTIFNEIPNSQKVWTNPPAIFPQFKQALDEAMESRNESTGTTIARQREKCIDADAHSSV